MTDSNEECNEDAWEYYDKVKDALNGLFEVLSVALEPDNILFYNTCYSHQADKLGLIKFFQLWI